MPIHGGERLLDRSVRVQSRGRLAAHFAAVSGPNRDLEVSFEAAIAVRATIYLIDIDAALLLIPEVRRKELE
jgi:hypothetical protein